MSIEEEIFTRCSIETNKLIDYGFKKINDKYVIEKFILNDSFKIVVEILNNERVKGRIYDLETNEEYTNFRINGEKGEFTSKVRSEFENFLIDIKKHCSKANYFNSKQANRITSLIINKYHNNPEFMWDKYPSDGIFRSENSDKWYGLIMSVKKAKLDVGDELVDILNVKLDPLEIKTIINKKGFYKAYHMNKDNWITLILDDTLKDEEIMEYVDKSYNLINKSNEW